MSFPSSPAFRLARRAVLMLAAALALGSAHADELSVSLETARHELESGHSLVFDIREPVEHATGVAASARLLPMSQLRQRLAEIPNDPAKPVLLICNTQNRSSRTLKALRETGGYTNVRFVEGGMSEWAKRGWPMIKPER